MSTFRPLALLMLAELLSPVVFCQPASAQATPVTVPDNILYRAFFHQAAVWKGFADKEVAQGIFDGPAAKHFRVVAGLTSGEDVVLKSIAVDCEAALVTIERQRSQITAPYRGAGLPNQTPLPPSVRQQLASLYAQRAAVLSGHLQQLKSAFATSRFQVLDAFVRKTIQFSRSPATPVK